ncbi:putative ATPase YjoB [Cyphellophora attinorum]|uniref:Putative ATPase YjoB n=1 Tax=Cyphellophora attinorum TaxID=1664694 RepID=A0A0N0NQ19_9EURO|nr:putative ATPase YjoB [Phialophora attinorum]KPI43401.1 putative ATPase YjoB [Phialophora attinorum]
MESNITNKGGPPPTPAQTFYANTTAPLPQYSCPLRAWAATNNTATITPLETPETLSWTFFIPASRRLDGGSGQLAREMLLLVYFVDGRDGSEPFGVTRNQYIVSATSSSGLVSTLLRECGTWATSLHDEIWVFNQGYWDKDSDLYASIMKASWDNVILHRELKEDLVQTITRFYDSRDTYHRLGVPWKRGIIFYGPPGNGKTISIKATMHTLYTRKHDPIPTLYVKSLQSFGGPEYSINQIFNKARKEAPCYLVFEDLDSMVTDNVRSYFLNAVDGLSENEGILMVGSTNHLDRLDPGIAKRPSRFDRKYLFDDPDESLRVRYAEFWRRKVLERGKEDKEAGIMKESLEFPEVLCKEIAKITDGFSFAYMQEAFVSTLLKIANDQEKKRGLDSGAENATRRAMKRMSEQWELLDLSDADDVDGTRKEKDGNDDGESKDLDKYVLWREIKAQVEMLRKEMSKERDE